MIIDNLENLSLYPQIPTYVADFILSLSSDIESKRIELSDNCYVNVERYLTKPLSDGKFEYHKKYIDIQLLLSGKERIFYSPKVDLSEPLEFDSSKDIGFYKDKISDKNYLTLDGSNFALIYPHEAHAPQISYDDSSGEVVKVVVKLLF